MVNRRFFAERNPYRLIEHLFTRQPAQTEQASPPAPPEFVAFGKIPRLNRDIIITEKIDGTNGQILVTDDGQVFAGSRNRYATPGKGTDNHGFAQWVQDNQEALRDLLGPGRHFGEWWGQGIARNYGLKEKRFSLFNTTRWGGIEVRSNRLLYTVPGLYQGPFDPEAITTALQQLKDEGSIAAPGFRRPEGIVVFHEAANQLFKVLLEHDDKPKSQAVA